MIALIRRTALAGLAGFPFAALSAGRASGAPADLETVTAQSAGGRIVTGFLSVPSKTPAPGVLLLHGAHGFSDWYKSLAVGFGERGFVGLVFNLFDGHSAETIVTWIEWLRRDQRTNGKVALVGYSLGAEWALRTSMSTPIDATVLHVGLILPDAKDLARLNGPVLGFFGTRDPETSQSRVQQLESTMREAGKSFEVHWYPTGHAFGKPDSPDYNQEALDAAWASTAEFLWANLQ